MEIPGEYPVDLAREARRQARQSGMATAAEPPVAQLLLHARTELCLDSSI